ncbi:MAG: hypothetical protein IPH26_03510 [Sterolibacteriaceae bacterium]|uniref:Uncharacterized protein n=1 Tax=Candidatus Methylophosphatis roskildensis TaxID=2899263 RepID=A0A9D7E0S1_9PROT|nr:hypothetical protein [Candidatus Methylophosphatis roskildensis]
MRHHRAFDRALRVVTLPLGRRDAVDRFEEVLRILARPATAHTSARFPALSRYSCAPLTDSAASEYSASCSAPSAVARQQGEVERRFFEFVGDVVGTFDQVAVELDPLGMLVESACLIDQFVGPMLPVARPLGIALDPLVRRRRAGRAGGHARRQRFRSTAPHARPRDRATVAARAAKPADQFGADFVAIQFVSPVLQHALAAGAQDELHETDRLAQFEHVVEPRAERRRRFSGEGKGIEDQLLAAGT